MKKVTRYSIFIVSGIFLLLLAFLFWAIQRVDYTPYFQTDYYRSTRTRLDSLILDASVSTGRLEVGFARALITPTIGSLRDDFPKGQFEQVPLAGYSDRKGLPATGIHDSLFVKAVAVKVGEMEVVLVSWDALIFPQEIAEGVLAELQKDLRLRRDQVLFSATHTHSGVGAWGEGFLAEQFAGKYNPAVRNWLIHQATVAIRKAIEDIIPGRFGFGTFHAPAFVRNRLVGNLGQVDDEFTYVIFRQQDGDYVILGAYAAHATVLSGGNMTFSGDYPGYWQRAIEKQIPGMAVFFAGGVGSHRPAGRGKGFEKAQYIGEALADSLLQYFPQTALSDTLSLSRIGLVVNLPEHHIRVTDGLRIHPALARKLVLVDKTYLQLIRLGNLLWVGTPCDFSGEVAIDLKNATARFGFTSVMTSFNGSYVGYLIPGKYYHYNSYESRLMSFFGPYMGDYFTELIRRLLLGMIERPA